MQLLQRLTRRCWDALLRMQPHAAESTLDNLGQCIDIAQPLFATVGKGAHFQWLLVQKQIEVFQIKLGQATML